MAIPKGSKKPKIVENPFSFYPLIEGAEVEGPLLGGNLPMDSDGLKRAAARVFLPRKQAQELAELRQEQAEDRAKIAALERATAKNAVAGKSRRGAPLRPILHAFKESNHDRKSDQLFIAAGVDAHLKKMRRPLPSVCPKQWLKYMPGGQLVELLDKKAYPKLHTLVKSYISKA